MEKQQAYSHGLLYSVAPDNLSTLHLKDEEVKKDTFDWEAYEAELAGDSLLQTVIGFLKRPFVRV